MSETLQEEYHADASNFLPTLRELLSKDVHAASYSAETLGRLLWELGCLPCQPADHEVEAALEALRVEGEFLA